MNFVFSQMVELYNDPHGDKITLHSSTIDRKSEKEVIELRRRINELERSLKNQVCFPNTSLHPHFVIVLSCSTPISIPTTPNDIL